MINGKIVDTSIWVDYFNKKANDKTIIVNSFIDNNEVVTIPVILQEVLQGIREDSVFKLVQETFLSFKLIKYDNIEAAVNAALLYRFLRKKGATIRKPND